MIIQALANSIIPVAQTIFSGFCSGFIPGLAEKLGSTCGDRVVNQLLPMTSAPGLVSAVSNDSRHIEALNNIRDHLVKSNDLKRDDTEYKRQFSRQLLSLLGEWQQAQNRNRDKQDQAIWDVGNLASKISREETKELLETKGHQMLVLTACPDVSTSLPSSFQDDLRISIQNDTRIFLNKNYPTTSDICPTTCYTDYFKVPISTLDTSILKKVLGATPTAVIYSEVNSDEVYFHVIFLNPKSDNIAQCDIPPWNWRESYETLKSNNKRVGDKEAYRDIRKAIVVMHQLLAAFIIDWYYLSINIFYEPRILVGFDKNYFDSRLSNIFEPYVETLRKIQISQRIGYLKGIGMLTSSLEANQGESAAKIAENIYEKKLKQTVSGVYPLTQEAKKELGVVESFLNLKVDQKNKISQPILAKKEKERKQILLQKERERKQRLKDAERTRKLRDKNSRVSEGNSQWLTFLLRGVGYIAGGGGVLWTLLFLFAGFANPAAQGSFDWSFLVIMAPGLLVIWGSNSLLRRFPKQQKT